MKTLKNGIQLSILTLQQFSTNNDILSFEFEKPKDFNLQGSLVQIIYEIDKLDNIKNNNITIEEDEEKIIITWLVKESITLTSGEKRTQIVIKNNEKVYLSSVFIIKVLESLNIDNEIVETNLSYLEYWEQRMNELAEKIEEFEGLDLTQFITKTKLEEELDNYFDKLEILEKLNLKADKTELEQFASKKELENKLDKSSFDEEKNTFQLKNDEMLETNNKTVVGAINEIKGEISSSDIDLSNYYNKLETDNLLNDKVNIQDVYNKQEIDQKIDEINIDTNLENYYNKQETDRLLESKANIQHFNQIEQNKQDKTDNLLNTTNKNITGAINEINSKLQNVTKPNIVAGNGININDTTISIKFDNKTIGLNTKGELEAKLSTGGSDEGNTNIKQYILKDVKSGTLYTIEDEGLPINHKVIPSVFAIESSKQSKLTVTDFKINTENLISNNGIKIQDKYTLNVSNSESEIITRGDFHKILHLKGGV